MNERNEFGHWEIDTVVGTRNRSAVLLTIDERVTRQLITVKIPSRSSEAVSEAVKKIVTQFGDKADKVFKSITVDNGSEFATLEEALPFAKVYFAHPYSSFERGTNEKQNSLIRRFFPKGKVWKMYLMMLLELLKIGLMHFQEKCLIIRVRLICFNNL